MSDVNELIEQIGGRERLEFLSEYRPNIVKGQVTFREVKMMASALLAVLDAKPVAYTHASEISNMHFTGLYIRGFPIDRRLNTEEGYTTPLYTAPPAASAPPSSSVPDAIRQSAVDSLMRHPESFFGEMTAAEVAQCIAAAPAPGGDGG